MHSALEFHRTVTAKGCRIHDDPLDCDPPVQAAHILSRQSLRRHGHGVAGLAGGATYAASTYWWKRKR